MYIENKACWLNILENALQKYNNRKHGTIKMTPTGMSTNKKTFFFPKNSIKTQIKPPKFQVGDFVRVPDNGNYYSKTYTTNWNRELFKIHQINNTNPLTYTLEDENGESIQGNYNQKNV